MSTDIIKINRGDSFVFEARIPDPNDLSKNYFLGANDIFYFALMYPNQPFEEALIKKGCTAFSKDELSDDYDQNKDTGIITVKLTPQETRYLVPGIYYYTTKLATTANSEKERAYCNQDDFIKVKTIIERTKFIINE
jgi:hypothetical protein